MNGTTDSAQPPAIEELTSLSDHEAAFSPDVPHAPMLAPPSDEEDDAEAPARVPRHRAQSQKAGPDDVAQIGALTKRLKTAEELAAKEAGITRNNGESERVWTLRRRAELAERHTQPKPIPAPPKPAAPVARQTATGFTEPEPRLEQFNDQPDPYFAWNRAVGAWDRKKEAFDAQQASAREQSTTAQRQHDEQFNTWVKERDDEHVARFDAYTKAHPEKVQKFLAASDLGLTPTMYAAVHLHPRGPELIEALIDHPDLRDDVFLLTDGKPVGDPLNNPLVAIVQRRLLQRVPAAPTGSVATPVRAVPAPRPPNPVRTAPQSPSDSPPGDGASLADHERFYGHKRRH